MASMTIAVNSVSAQGVATTAGFRKYNVTFPIKVSANSYTSTRYLHYKVISTLKQRDGSGGSVYGGYIKMTSGATGTYSRTISGIVFPLLSTDRGASTVTETVTVYTQVTTSTSQPGSSGWINKKSYSFALPGPTIYHIHYSTRYGGVLRTDTSYEGVNYAFYNPGASPRFRGWCTSHVAPISLITLPHSELLPAQSTVNVGYAAITVDRYYTPLYYPFLVKVSGTWLGVLPRLKVSGEWLEAKEVYVKINGAWQALT